jgi:hypothetical protein
LATQGDVDACCRQLPRCLSPNVRDARGLTALGIAVAKGDVALCRILLGGGVAVDARQWFSPEAAVDDDAPEVPSEPPQAPAADALEVRPQPAEPAVDDPREGRSQPAEPAAADAPPEVRSQLLKAAAEAVLDVRPPPAEPEVDAPLELPSQLLKAAAEAVQDVRSQRADEEISIEDEPQPARRAVNRLRPWTPSRSRGRALPAIHVPYRGRPDDSSSVLLKLIKNHFEGTPRTDKSL